jgi:hypothetical protein
MRRKTQKKQCMRRLRARRSNWQKVPESKVHRAVVNHKKAALYGAGCWDRCFVLEALSDTLSSDHEQDTVLLLFTSDDVLRLDSYGYDSCPRSKPRPDSAQIGFRFEYAGAV